MSVELLVAPPASGKTHDCIERIQSLRREKPFATVWVIVPDRMQAAAFRRRLAAAGGAMNVQVSRFNDLFSKLLERAGRHTPQASIPLVRRLIRDTVDETLAHGTIPYLAPLQPFPGFSLVLQEIFSELNQAFVSPKQFTAFTESRVPMQKELAILFTDYQERLQKMDWADGNQLPLLAASLLQDDPQAASWIDLLVVDGFDSFNGSQAHLLKLLSRQVVELLITFPGSIKSNRRVHQRFQEGIENLSANLAPSLTELPAQPFLPPVVKGIEKYIFDETGADENQNLDKPILLEARSPAEEVRETLRWFKKLVVRDKVPITECAIFTPNPATYHPLLRDIAGEFGIPIRFSLDEPLEQSPSMSALLNLLELPTINFRTRSLLNVLRSPYFKLNPEEVTVDTLERISRVARIVEGVEQWDETWDRLENSSNLENQDLDDERNAPSLPRGPQASPLRDLMDAIFRMLTPPVGEHPQKEWIGWLEDLLEQVGFFEGIESERDLTALDAFHELLQALLLSESVAGIHSLSYGQFFNSLQSMLSGAGYRESGRAYRPALLVGRMQEARGLRFRAVSLMGLSEGSFPITERADPFLDEELRASLGLEPRLNRDQAGLFYQALTRTDAHLLITRPYLSGDGEDWEPSAFWKAVARLFDDSAVTRVRSDDDRPLADAASSQELLFSALHRKALPGEYKSLEERWTHLRHAREILSARRDRQASGEFEGILEKASSSLQERYGGDGPWSASSLGTYAKCPFLFLVNNTLELEAIEPPELGMDALQMGSMLHSILEHAYADASDPADPDVVMESLHKTAEKEFSEAPRKYGFRPSALWDIEQDQILEKLETTIELLTGDDGWKPIAFEARFGLGGKPPLLVDIGGENIRLRGVIDRVDRNSDGQLRVIDYKTGGTYLKSDLEKGVLLQLPLYALAAREVLKLGTPVSGFYWVINKGEARLKLKEVSNKVSYGIEDSIEIMRKSLEKSINGIRSAKFPPIPPEGGCPFYCPAALWCWRYEGGWSP